MSEVINRSPVGPNCSASTSVVCADSEVTRLHVAVCQTRTMPSLHPVASRPPSGLNAAAPMVAWGSASGAKRSSAAALAVSHMRSGGPSAEPPLTSRDPSGLNARACANPVW